MASLIVDPRDQKFVLYEMLNVEELCGMPFYADLSRDMFDMALNEAEKFSANVVFPCLVEGDREGCPAWRMETSASRNATTGPRGSTARGDGRR